MPDATDVQLRPSSKVQLRRERRRAGRTEAVSPQILSLLRPPAPDRSPPQDDIEAPRAPADGVRTATPEGLIIDFLITHKRKPFCDDCLKQQFRQVRPSEIAVATKAIGPAVGFRKVAECCTGCGKVRAGIKAR